LSEHDGKPGARGEPKGFPSLQQPQLCHLVLEPEQSDLASQGVAGGRIVQCAGDAQRWSLDGDFGMPVEEYAQRP